MKRRDILRTSLVIVAAAAWQRSRFGPNRPAQVAA